MEELFVDVILPIALTLALIAGFRLCKGAPLTNTEIEQLSHVFDDSD